MSQSTRRKFLQKAGYAAPVVLTLTASPAMAQTGSSGRQMDEPSGRTRPVRSGRRDDS